MEGSWFLANGHELTVLSEQQILACDLTDFVCDGGYPASAFRFVIVSGGAVSEQTCAYNFTQLTVDTLGKRSGPLGFMSICMGPAVVRSFNQG
jgi:hypothetical protein